MIGIFDSGSGGFTFLAAARRALPQYSYLYYGDYDHCPYGDRSPEEILKFTTDGVYRLFEAGAQIVILACNTASSCALKKFQTKIFLHKRILGVTIPAAEKALELGLDYVTVFATGQTVKSGTYKERMGILDSDIQVREIALPGELVRKIESLLPVQRCRSMEEYLELEKLYQNGSWACIDSSWSEIVDQYFHLPEANDQGSQGIILGCTHYSYLRSLIEKRYPNYSVLDPSEEAALALRTYITKHDIDIVCGSGGVTFL